MKKFIDIFLLVGLFFLTFSLFSQSNTTQNRSEIQFTSQKSSYSVPAGVVLDLSNYTENLVDFDFCEALELRYNGEKIELPEALCQRETLSQNASKSYDFSPYYDLFSNPGSYIFTLTLDEKEYISHVEVQYKGFFGKLFTGLFYAPVFNLLIFFISFFGNSLGMGILAVTIFLRILLLFPQHKMLVSQRKMQAIQPKIKEIQEKFKGNQQMIGMELLKLYKEEGVNPMGSCGFLLIQMPILFVIYNIISHITSQKNEFYLYPFFENFHISNIDFVFLGFDLLSSKGTIGIIAAIIVAWLQYLQVRLSLMHHKKWKQSKDIVLEKKPGEKNYSQLGLDPEMMNKMMLYFIPGMVAVFTFSLPLGVWLYWAIWTLFAIFQQLFVNRLIKSK